MACFQKVMSSQSSSPYVVFCDAWALLIGLIVHLVHLFILFPKISINFIFIFLQIAVCKFKTLCNLFISLPFCKLNILKPQWTQVKFYLTRKSWWSFVLFISSATIGSCQSLQPCHLLKCIMLIALTFLVPLHDPVNDCVSPL